MVHSFWRKGKISSASLKWKMWFEFAGSFLWIAGSVSYSLFFDNFILLQICLQSPIFISPFSSKPFQSFPINRDKCLTQTHTQTRTHKYTQTDTQTQAHTQTSTHTNRHTNTSTHTQTSTYTNRHTKTHTNRLKPINNSSQ